jgi:hypothetical protein
MLHCCLGACTVSPYFWCIPSSVCLVMILQDVLPSSARSSISSGGYSCFQTVKSTLDAVSEQGHISIQHHRGRSGRQCCHLQCDHPQFKCAVQLQQAELVYVFVGGNCSFDAFVRPLVVLSWFFLVPCTQTKMSYYVLVFPLCMA